jgi:hypothetical protein
MSFTYTLATPAPARLGCRRFLFALGMVTEGAPGRAASGSNYSAGSRALDIFISRIFDE